MSFVRTAPAVLLAFSLQLTGCNGEYEPLISETPTFVGEEPSIDHGSWLSMDVAPDGQRMVVAYYDRERGGLSFAIGTPAEDGTVEWVHEHVDGYEDPSSGLDLGDRGRHASMKVAPDGTVWIAYYDYKKNDGKGNLRYAHRPGGPGTWVSGLVDPGSGLRTNAGEWASLDLDADGNPVIAYYDGGEKVLKVARPTDLTNGTVDLAWTVTEVRRGEDFVGIDAEGATIQRDADVGKFTRLLIAGATEYIATYDAAQQRLSLLEGSNGVYNHSYVTPEGSNMGQWPSMLLDSGTLLLAFHDVGNQDLVVATRNTGGYDLEVADAGEFVGADTEIIKRGGNLAVLYFDGQNNDMKVAEKAGSVWVTETLGDPDAAVGFHNEIVRINEQWWAASYDFTNRSIFVKQVDEDATP